MDRIKEEIKYITLYETPETDEALALLNKYRDKFRRILLTTFIIAIGVTFICSMISLPLMFTSLALFAISLLIIFLIRNSTLAPYKQLLLIARRNDRIRHEERVKYKEHMRLEKEFKPYKPTKKQIEETLNVDGLVKPKKKGK